MDRSKVPRMLALGVGRADNLSGMCRLSDSKRGDHTQMEKPSQQINKNNLQLPPKDLMYRILLARSAQIKAGDSVQDRGLITMEAPWYSAGGRYEQ